MEVLAPGAPRDTNGPTLNRLGDGANGVRGGVVLPESNYHPTASREMSVCIRVSRAVRC